MNHRLYHKAGAEAVHFAKGYLIPGANLWYAKAALDHADFHELQEYFSPGHLARQANRAQSLYGTEYWWHPGQSIEQAQSPDLGKIAGNQ